MDNGNGAWGMDMGNGTNLDIWLGCQIDCTKDGVCETGIDEFEFDSSYMRIYNIYRYCSLLFLPLGCCSFFALCCVVCWFWWF